MKYFTFFLCVCLLLSGCAAPAKPAETTEAPLYITNKSEPTESVFNTKNVTRITFYAYYGGGKGSDVPADQINAIQKWLDTFTPGEEASVPLEPGTNTIHVEIEYQDGTVIKQGLDTVTLNGITYKTKYEKPPACFQDILSRTSLEDESTAPAPEIGPEDLPTPAL